VSSFLLGVFFAAGWSPCVGIILSSIFAVAATQGARAGVLFFFYALGLGIPFILTALAFSWAAPFLRRMNRHLGIISAISGVFLIVVGVMLLTDQFVRLATILPIYEPGLDSSGQVSEVPLVFGIFIAAFGGLLSFLSPCVMPLVPGYLGYLTGTVVQTPTARDGAA
jgi:cytochrome c-type biogenesis protein